MPYQYSAYGLVISSELELPELPCAAASRPDVTVRIEPIDHLLVERGSDGNCFQTAPGLAYLYWEVVGAFLISHGTEIIIDPKPGVDDKLLRLPLLGMVFSVLLHQRGLLALHASAVAIDGAAVAFLGRQGQGKSTMAAALNARGHPLVADDVVAIDLSKADMPLVYPGFPQLKLWPEALVHTLGDDPATTPRLHEQVEKRARRVTEYVYQESIPLRSVYLLGRGPAPAITPLSPAQALIELIRNTHSAQLDEGLLAGVAGAQHFQQCVKLLQHVEIYRLTRPFAIELLPHLARLIEDLPRFHQHQCTLDSLLSG